MPLRIPILMYHKVAPVDKGSKVPSHYVSPEAFRRQLAALTAMGFKSVSMDGLFERETQRRPIVLTFDDGYQNFYSNALPLLEGGGFTATVYLVANQLGGTNEWDARSGDVEEPLMTVQQIKESHAFGIEFGSHTLDHKNLASVDSDIAWTQVANSKAVLEEKLSLSITSFCYPYGSKTPEVKAMVERAGYATGCSTEKGVNDPSTDRFALKRINIRRDTSLPIFVYKILRGFAVGR